MNLKLKSLIEISALYFLLLQGFSAIYLYFFWMILGVNFFDYVSMRDVISSSGRFSIYFTFFAVVWVFFLHDFSISSKSKLFPIKYYTLFFVLTMMLCTASAVYLPYEYKYIWFFVLFLNAMAIHYFVSSLVISAEGNVFKNRFSTYSFLFIIFSGLSFSVVVPVWEAVKTNDKSLSEVRYVKVKECDECYYWFLGRLGDFSFVTVTDDNKVIAIPNSNVENITHYSNRR